MADKIKLFIQKRTSLKAQITNLTNLIDKERYDTASLKHRMTRITELYHAYEDLNDEILILDPNGDHTDEFTRVQERFYALVGKVEGIINRNYQSSPVAVAGSSNVTNSSLPTTDTTAVAKRRVKLPEASLPRFDGRYENWLTFKNTFLAMIDTRTDLADIEKLQYLISAVTGDAANKIKFLTIEDASYSKAWELLTRAYEVKRMLVSSHLSLLFNSPALEKETTDGLTKLADDAQQHVASLAKLGVSVGSEILVNLLESKLPKRTAEKWEETLSRDDFPDIDELYEFLYRTAVRVSKRVRTETSRQVDEKNSPACKKIRIANKAFVINRANNCVVCKNKQHPLFKCDKFKELEIPKRIEIVKNAKLCYNCMRSHLGRACNYTNCTVCHRRHNTLLHLERKPVVEKKDVTSGPKTDERD